MKKIIFSAMFLSTCLMSFSQNVGIGTSTPKARLHVADSNVVFSATGESPITIGNVPITGAGRRLMWYADKAAFRAGYANGTDWDSAAIGKFSFAGGYRSKASGFASVALGSDNNAAGESSVSLGALNSVNGTSGFAAGSANIVNGSFAFAGGYYNTSAGICSIALGSGNYALGDYSAAVGQFTKASGYASTAMGINTIASADFSTAIGASSTASGMYSVAMGTKVSTNLQAGSFFFGDSDPNNKGIRPIGSPNQIAMRFNNGYYFITSDVAGDIGVRVLAGQNSWSAISDVRLKENFLPVEGENFLQKISKLNLTTWNYKGQSPETFRHYGPMAQDFFTAFGKDAMGIIGCDTLINQQDFLGINLIAIQGLEKRTTLLKEENEKLKMENKKLERQLLAQQKEIEEIRKSVEKLR